MRKALLLLPVLLLLASCQSSGDKFKEICARFNAEQEGFQLNDSVGMLGLDEDSNTYHVDMFCKYYES